MKKKKKINFLFFAVIIITVIGTFAFLNKDELTEKGLLIYADINLEHKNYENAYKIYNSLNQYYPKDNEIKNKMTICLCKMPLTYSVQKKLLEIAQQDDGSEAEKMATSRLLNFRKKIFKKYGENYVKEILFNNTVLRWSKKGCPITYYIKVDSETPDYYIKKAEEVFKAWQRESDDFITFSQVNNEAGAKISVKFQGKADMSVLEKNSDYEAGITKPIIEKDRILKAMKINILNKTHKNEFFTEEQIKTLITHEVGHALGLYGHTKDNSTIMYYSLDNDYDFYQNRIDTSLTPKDINTLKLLYSLAPDVCDNPKETEEKEKYIYHKALFDVLDDNKNAAVNDAIELLRVNPNNMAYSLSLADAYTADGKFEESINVMLLLTNNTTDKNLLNILYYNIANNYILLKDFENALLYSQKALKINNNTDNKCLVAYVQFLSGNLDDAEIMFRKVLSKQPSNINASLGLADVCIKKKQYLEARKILKQLIKLNPNAIKDKNFAPYKIYVII